MERPSWCPFEGHKYGRRKPTKTSVFDFSYKSVNSSLKELTNIKVVFILRNGMFRQQTLKKLDVFNPLASFPGRQLNAASRKSVGIQASFIAKTNNPFEPKIKVVGYFNTSCKWKLKRIDSFLVRILVTSYENQQ